MAMGATDKTAYVGSLKVGSPIGVRYRVTADSDHLVLHEEIINTMRNVGAKSIKELKPEMVGPAGPWVGLNRPPYILRPAI